VLSAIKTNTKLQAKLGRRAIRRAIQTASFGRQAVESSPIFFANSFPKSGTHLLTQILQGFARIGPAVNSGLPAIVTFEGESGQPRAENIILKELRRLIPGDIAYGHLHSSPGVVSFLCSPGVAAYVVVSHVYYVTEITSHHALHHYYFEELQDFNERLKTSILGRPDWNQPFPDIRTRFDPYLGWMENPEILVLRFEDLQTNMRETIRRVLEHASARGFRVIKTNKLAVDVLIAGVYPQRSPTFRRGKIGSWRTSFTVEHKQIFKEVAGDLLIKLGYEQDNGW